MSCETFLAGHSAFITATECPEQAHGKAMKAVPSARIPANKVGVRVIDLARRSYRSCAGGEAGEGFLLIVIS